MLAFKQNNFFGLATILVLIPYLFGWTLPNGLDAWFLIISLALTGIPHGAIDHVIFLKNQDGNSKNNNILITFFTPYLIMIGVTFALWFFLPEVMFWFFLLVAAYHFGQSQLYYIDLTKRTILKTLIYLMWGSFILSALWLFHWESQSVIISSIFNWNLLSSGTIFKVVQFTAVLSGIGTLGIFFYLFAKNKLTSKMLIQEITVLCLLSVLFYFASPYMAFAIYFCLWHATRVIITEYNYLSGNSSLRLSIKDFVKSFLPFSLLSFVGLALLFWASQLLQASISPFMLFLIFISALTMPHAFFMEKMYKFLGHSLKAKG